MDKVQMTVTLVEADLLTYLRQFPSARERSFVLHMLARQGLQTLGALASNGQPYPPIPGLGVRQPTPPLDTGPVSDGRSTPHETALSRPASVSPSVSSPAIPTTTHADARIDSAAETTTDPGAPLKPLAGIDIAALNHALARH